ncbi:MAG TPA: TonB-dependent receptor, partial [Novosphingobium sp.]|nr:TonB-dependent receptor [Novosphingobium sp.]
MSIRFLCGASALPLLLVATPALADHPVLVDTIIVSGQRIEPLAETTEPVSGHASLPDAAALAARLPGAALINNGALSGQVQYRGLFSDRLAIRVGGQSFQTGGPNAMDPPLHYAPAILLDRITVSRGAAQVSEGPGLGGSVDARLKSLGFGSGPSLAPAASLAGSWRSTDDGLAVGGVAGLASESLRFNAIAAWEEGGDYRFPGGRAADTSYSRLTWGLSAGWRSAPGTLSIDYRRQETGKSGNPPFAMDIDYFHTDFLRAAFEGEIAGAPVELALGHVDVGHGMDNFSRRPPPATLAQYRYSTATAQTFTGSLKVKLGAVSLGVDGMGVDRTVTISNPNNAAFQIGSLDRVRQHRWGGFAELAIEQGNLRGDLGLRLDRHGARMAPPRTGAAVPAMVTGLAASTAAALSPRRDTTWDAVGRL